MIGANFPLPPTPVCFRISVYMITLNEMAPRLPTLRLYLIRDMIESESFTISSMAEEAECIISQS